MRYEAFKEQMTTEFEMSDLGLMSFYLGIEVDQQKELTRICKQSAKQIWYGGL